jgi:hypothetical protein
MEADFTLDEVINLMKRTKKTDRLFKPLKKLKTAIEVIPSNVGNWLRRGVICTNIKNMCLSFRIG